MLETALVNGQSGNFGLKNQVVELSAPRHTTEVVAMELKDLEALRSRHASVPASRYQLETICGASCETAAQ